MSKVEIFDGIVGHIRNENKKFGLELDCDLFGKENLRMILNGGSYLLIKLGKIIVAFKKAGK